MLRLLLFPALLFVLTRSCHPGPHPYPVEKTVLPLDGIWALDLKRLGRQGACRELDVQLFRSKTPVLRRTSGKGTWRWTSTAPTWRAG